MTELLGQLTSQLGIDESQAKGGLGSMLKLAQDKLGEGDFSQISGLFGDSAGELLGAAPSKSGGGMMDMLGSAASALGVDTGDLGQFAALAGSFKDLGIDMNTVTKFAPIVMDWVQSEGGEDILGLLKKAF